MKKDKNEITYVPYYGEFKSLTKEQLKARQNQPPSEGFSKN